MKLSIVLLILATISFTQTTWTGGYVKSYLQVNDLQPTVAVGTYEKTRWNPSMTGAQELICDSTENIIGGDEFSYGVLVSTNRALKKHYKVRVSATFYFFDFGANDNFVIRADNTDVLTLTQGDLLAGPTACTYNGGAHSASAFNKYVLTHEIDAHAFSSLDLTFQLTNPNDGSSTATWGVNTLTVCSMGYGSDNTEDADYGSCDTTDGPVSADLGGCAAEEIIYEDGCQTTAYALQCYQDLDTFRGDAAQTTKFTRASTVEQDDVNDNATQRVQVVWTFSDFAHSDCVDYEVTFDSNRIPSGTTAGAQNEWYRDGTTSIEYSVPTSYIRDNCVAADFDATYQTHTCTLTLSVIENFTVQYKEVLSVVLKVQKLDTEIVDEINLVIESENTDVPTDGSCCENTLDIQTELVLCQDQTCALTHQTTANDPYVIKKNEVVYFQHRIVNPGIYSAYYLNLKTFKVGYFEPNLITGQITNELTKNTFGYYPGLAGSNLQFSVISVLSASQSTDFATDVTNGLEAAPTRRALDVVGDDYKLLGVAYITIQDEDEVDGNYDIVQGETDKQISNNKEVVSTEENSTDSNLVIAVIVGIAAVILFSVVGTVVYVRSINKPQKGSNKQKYEKKRTESDIEINNEKYLSSTERLQKAN